MNNRLFQAHAGGAGRRQTGVMLLEALIAILVFSLGILTVIAIQAASIKMTADAQQRTKAALLANRLVGEMWVSDAKIGDLATKFKSPNGDAYKEWLKAVQADLPGVGGKECDANEDDPPTSTLPSVTVETTAGESLGQVRITLCWRTPTMKSDEKPHRHIVTSQITRNP